MPLKSTGPFSPTDDDTDLGLGLGDSDVEDDVPRHIRIAGPSMFGSQISRYLAKPSLSGSFTIKNGTSSGPLTIPHQLHTVRIDFIEYWCVVETDDNDHLGFMVFFKASCECLSIFVLLLVIIFFIVIWPPLMHEP